MAKLRKEYRNKIDHVNKKELHKPIVFVVDMINGFINEGALSDKSILNIVEDIERLLTDISPSVFVCDAHDLDAREFDSYPIHCIENTHESFVIDELKPYAKRMVYKNSTNTFMATGFQDMLEEILLNYQDIVIVGCCSDICILQFAISLNTYLNESNLNKHRVIVPVNMIETFHIEGVHEQMKMNEIACELMQANGIEVIYMR